jgi:hypothetical protein
VCFDRDVVIPALYERDRCSRGNPWMSLTPSEIFTLRRGTVHASGHVVIAGLGMGYQLIAASRRKQVKRITLVERDEELVAWLRPVLAPRLRCPVKWVVGDAYEVMPKLTADVALVDIFPGFGDVRDDAEDFFNSCPTIPRIWCWGLRGYLTDNDRSTRRY